MVRLGELCGRALGASSLYLPAGHRDIPDGKEPDAEAAGRFKVAPAADKGGHAGPPPVELAARR